VVGRSGVEQAGRSGATEADLVDPAGVRGRAQRAEWLQRRTVVQLQVKLGAGNCGEAACRVAAE
jgi:hypothetical protein